MDTATTLTAATAELTASEHEDQALVMPMELVLVLAQLYLDDQTLWMLRDCSKVMRAIASEALLDRAFKIDGNTGLRGLLEFVRGQEGQGGEAVELEDMLGLHRHIDSYVAHQLLLNADEPPKMTDRFTEWTEYDPTMELTTNERFELQEAFRRAAGRSGRVSSRLYLEWKEEQQRLTRHLRQQMARVWCIASDWNSNRLFPFTAAENKDRRARREAKAAEKSMDELRLSEQKQFEHIASYNPRAGLQLRLTKRGGARPTIEFYVDHLTKFAALQRAYSVRFPPTLSREQRKALHEKAEELRKEGSMIWTRSFGQASGRFLIAYRS